MTPFSLLITQKRAIDKISTAELQNLAFLSGANNNQDGHLGNILALLQADGTYLPVVIDNGFSFGEIPSENHLILDYLHFPQMRSESVQNLLNRQFL